MVLKGLTPRLYQEAILATAILRNTMVVLPTGLGKTAIAALVAAHRLKSYPSLKIVFLAPTRPLVQQHLETFKSYFDSTFALFTGQVRPEKRVELWKESTFIFSTPQGLENDVISGKITFDDVSLLVFDEAHRATGDYAYVFLAKRYSQTARYERILGLTASPGSNEETIREICGNLFIEDLEVRGYEDADVKQYVQKTDVTWHPVVLSDELLKIKKYLDDCYASKLREAHTLGVMTGKPDNYTKTSLLALQRALYAKISGDKSYELLKTVSLLAESLKIQHALELCETQTVSALYAYMRQLQTQAVNSKVKAVKNLVADPLFKSALVLVERLYEEGAEHPKVAAVCELVEEIKGKVIIFTQYRDTAKVLKNKLSDAEIFVGQMKKGGTGLSQKKQKELLKRFREDEFSILIATSVAEEGLDIPAVNTVLFYEPVPSAIRTVQRRGRTGRHGEGKVVVLIASGTRDEGYRWSAHHKEKRMYRTLKKMKKGFTVTPQKSLSEFSSAGITVDYREKGSSVMKALLDLGVTLDLEQLKVGDYKISEEIVVEYKTVRDFVDSIVDGRLLSQLSELRNAYKPVLIVEGIEDIYAQRRVNPASIRGMLATIILNYHIPVLRTTNAQDTAGVLLALAKRTQDSERVFQRHLGKPLSLKEQQEYLISSLPGIGTKLAKELLIHFGSVVGVLCASVEELQKVDLVGKKKAESIRKVLDESY